MTTLSRRGFLASGMLALGGLALSSCAGGSAGSMVKQKVAEVTYEDMLIPNLPPQFNGMKLTLASDFHSSVHMSPAELKQIARRINDLQSDIILLPGDFVTALRSEFPPVLEAFSELNASRGIYASTGNHDHSVDADMISEGLEDIGIKVLRNENTFINIGGEKLYLLGVDDDVSDSIEEYVKGEHAPHIEAMFKGVPNDSATIALAHKPYKFEDYAQADIGLMVSGHTHGGQIVIARIGRQVISLCSLASHFVDGIYEATKSTSKTKMYVSRGLGVVDIPYRLNCPPEITQFTLRSPSLAAKISR